jgi:hypothetical protein
MVKKSPNADVNAASRIYTMLIRARYDDGLSRTGIALFGVRETDGVKCSLLKKSPNVRCDNPFLAFEVVPNIAKSHFARLNGFRIFC